MKPLITLDQNGQISSIKVMCKKKDLAKNNEIIRQFLEQNTQDSSGRFTHTTCVSNPTQPSFPAAGMGFKR